MHSFQCVSIQPLLITVAVHTCIAASFGFVNYPNPVAEIGREYNITWEAATGDVTLYLFSDNSSSLASLIYSGSDSFTSWQPPKDVDMIWWYHFWIQDATGTYRNSISFQIDPTTASSSTASDISTTNDTSSAASSTSRSTEPTSSPTDEEPSSSSEAVSSATFTQTNDSNNPNERPQERTLSSGAVVGIVLLVVGFIKFVMGIIWLHRRRKHLQSQQQQQSTSEQGGIRETGEVRKSRVNEKSQVNTTQDFDLCDSVQKDDRRVMYELPGRRDTIYVELPATPR